MRVGLFGGSFNPAHAGHLHASEIALKYLGLDAIWWLVTTGNPLKSKTGLPDVETRMGNCRKLISNPRIIVTDLERQMKTVRTFDTVAALQSHFSQTEFVWISGTDIAYEFHKWYKSQQLMKTIPFAFVGRPSDSGLVRRNSFRQSAFLSHSYPLNGIRPKLKKGHIFWIFSESRLDISSTQLRNQVQGSTDLICSTSLKGVE